MTTSKLTAMPPPDAVARSRQLEATLVARCRRGEAGAFEEIYRTHAPRLFGLIVRMVGNQPDAEDLLQEVFLAAHRKLDGFRGESALGTWLYRLTTNHVLDHLRSRAARTGQMTDTFDDDPVLPDPGSRAIAERTIAQMDLERALAQLPDGCRAAFLLHDVEGLEHREVAEALGIAEGTSKSQVHKARLRLRALLGGTRRR